MLPRVLVVEDAQLLLDILGHGLKRMGIQGECADNGSKAIELIAANDYALVITDLVLPGVSGLDLIRIVKAKSPETRILAITGHGEKLLAMAREAGADFTLRKPFTMKEIMDAIENYSYC